MDAVRKEFEETALMGCKAVRAFLTYQGNNKDYRDKAKAGAVAMGSYSRLRATMANETALTLMAQKQLSRGVNQALVEAGEDGDGTK